MPIGYHLYVLLNFLCMYLVDVIFVVVLFCGVNCSIEPWYGNWFGCFYGAKFKLKLSYTTASN